MSKFNLNFLLTILLLSADLSTTLGQAPSPLLTQPQDKLLAVLNSDAPQKEKADACRQLAVVGTGEAVAPLAALLQDEKLSHMARCALETIADPAASEVLRLALARLKGRPLIGVIGSIAVRREAKAVEALRELLSDTEADVAQATARALGSIGTSTAARALDTALDGASSGNRLALCEGLLRCAEV